MSGQPTDNRPPAPPRKTDTVRSPLGGGRETKSRIDDEHDHSSSIRITQRRDDGLGCTLAVGDGVGQVLTATGADIAHREQRWRRCPTICVDHDMP